MSVPTVHKRGARQREMRRSLTAATAAEAIGEIGQGCEIFGLTKGQFSLVDIILHVLATTGPADVTISTWTAAGADLAFAQRLMTDGKIRTCRFVVDFSFPTRQPEYCAALRERFGDLAVRITKTHAKFVTIRNEGWSVVVRSSMNLNENRRLESFEISDDPAMADYLETVVDELFSAHQSGAQFAQTPYQRVVDFEREFGEGERSAPMADGDRRFFGDGPYDRDLRRVGRTAG